MISAHHSGQIFADLGIYPCCFMSEELYSIIVNLLAPQMSILTWTDNAQFCDPSLAIQLLTPDSYTTPPMLSKEYGLVIIPYWALLYSKCPRSLYDQVHRGNELQ